MSNPSLILPQSPAYAVSNVYAAQVYDGEVPVYDVLPLTFTRASGGSRINTSGFVEQMGTNIPRVTYPVNGGCGALLLEKQSTNLVSYSQNFSNGFWNKTNVGIGDVAVITPNYAISPDGTQNASRFVCNLNGGTTASTRSWMLANFTPQATVTLSIWIKLNSAGTKTFVFSDSGGGTKTISGTDWQRIDATFVGASGEFRIGLVGGSSSDTLDCCIWGAQAEAGTYPTSYISTTSSTVTRIADACYKTGISNLIGQTEGTIFLDINFNLSNQQDDTRFVLSDGSTNNWIFVGYPDGGVNNKVRLYVSTTAATVTFYSTNALLQGRNKIACGYKSGSFVIYLNGVLEATNSTTMTIPTCSNLTLEGSPYVNTASEIVNLNDAQIFTTRLTNAQLATLTTL